MKRLIALLTILILPLVVRAQISGAGQLSCNGVTISGTVINSSLANNTVVLSSVSNPAYAILIQLDQTTTVTGGVVTFQLSYDGGANYITAPVAQVLNPSTGAQLTNPYTLVASTNQSFLIPLAGASNFQVKLTTAMTGTGAITPYMTVLCTQPTIGPLTLDSLGNLLIKLNAALPTGSNTVGKVDILGNSAVALDAVIGASAPANVLAEGLKDTAGNSEAALSDVTGRQFTKSYPDTTTTSYHASASFAGSSTTDNAVMPGNATNTVLLNKVSVTCSETTAGLVTLTLIKRSAADTSGTSATMTKVPDDANYTAAVSAPLTYTGTGPSVGAAVGNLDVAQFGCNASATTGPNDIYIFRPMKPIILRGTAQQVAVNMGNAAITGGTLTVTFEWEETTTP
jgi:hypothetical protein